MTSGTINVSIGDVVVGERRREDLGDVAALAESIAKYGLLHPIVIDDDKRLVAGERRLRACQRLGWSTIEATPIGLLTDAALREIELEENLRRKDLTAYEQARTTVELAQVASAVDVEEFRPESGHKSRGRPVEPGSLRRVEERIGIPRTTINKAERHVETADAFPAFQSPAWKQYHVLEAKEQLDKLPASDRPKAVAIIDQPGIPPQAALPILRNIALMAESQRSEVFRLNESEDKRERSLALTTAADRPPMPDPRLVPLRAMVRDLRSMARSYPSDPLTPGVLSAADAVGSVVDSIERGGANGNANGRA